MTLQADQLGCSRDGHILFGALNFEVKAGEALWLTGANGSGKTSLLRLLCGLGVPQEGTVRWDGRAIGSLRQDFYRDLMYCGHASGVKDDLAAWENVAIGAALAGKKCTRVVAEHALEQIGLGDVSHLPTGALSQGQRKRVALARLFIHPLPRLLILDEPFSALDPAGVASLCAALEHHLQRGGIVIYTTHQAVELQAQRLHLLDLSACTTAICAAESTC